MVGEDSDDEHEGDDVALGGEHAKREHLEHEVVQLRQRHARDLRGRRISKFRTNDATPVPHAREAGYEPRRPL